MNETVFNYVKKFYLRVQETKDCMSPLYGIPSIDAYEEFYKNWTINFYNSGDPEYRLWDGTKVEAGRLYALVQEDYNKGFFTRELKGYGVHYRMTELGRNYIEFKLEL